MWKPSSEHALAPAEPIRASPGNGVQVRRSRILVVDDDEILSRFLGRFLATEGFAIECAYDGDEAIDALQPKLDLVILDLDLPKLDGIAVLRQMRIEFQKLTVLVLTARNGAGAKALALESGADDCVSKPFSCVELLARIRALLRRSNAALPRSSQCADLSIYRDELRVTRNTTRVDLTPREYGLLEFLMRSPGVPVSRAVLLMELWGEREDVASNIVDVYMKYVRDKVDRPGLPKLIRTVRGLGYVVSEH